jgi:hypothetical protein
MSLIRRKISSITNEERVWVSNKLQLNCKKNISTSLKP